MAKIEWKEPIEAMHGKVVGNFGAAKRKHANAKGEQINYSVRYGTRDLTLHPVSESEQAARDKFSAISKLVKARRADAQKKVSDPVAFKAQTAIPTYTQFLWTKAKADYLASLSQD